MRSKRKAQVTEMPTPSRRKPVTAYLIVVGLLVVGVGAGVAYRFWPQYHGVTINRTDQAVMVWVPGGSFLMGDNQHEDASPERQVELDGYWIYKYEVTVKQYRTFCTETGRTMPPAPGWGWQDDHPMVAVTWYDAAAYAKWAGAALPTAAE